MKRMNQLAYNFGIVLRFYPSNQQKKIIKLNYDNQRFVYNTLVGTNRELYHIKQVHINSNSHTGIAYPLEPGPSPTLLSFYQEKSDLISTIKHIRDKFPFLRLKGTDSLALANAGQNYRKAWNMYHQIGAGIPTFHRKSYTWSYQTNAYYDAKYNEAYLDNGTVRFLDKDHVKLPILGRVRVSGLRKEIKKRLSKHIPTRIGTVTIKKSADGIFTISLSLASDIPFAKPMQKVGDPIGIDLNTTNFLYASDGTEVANPRFYRKNKKKLAKLQRIMSRRQRRANKEHRNLYESKNYQKQRLKVAKLQASIRRKRTNFLQETSTALIKNHDLVVAEELRSRNMLKNHKLAMSIADAGWREFLNDLEYKAEMYGKDFHTINPAYTTQRCHTCGIIMGRNGRKKIELGVEEWTCPNCHAHHIRDYNAAINNYEKYIGVWK